MRPKNIVLGPKSRDRRGRNLIRFTITARDAYFEAMPAKPLELPPKVAKTFVKHMRDFYAEPSAIKRDRIAGDAAHKA
jgi:hypothetical protein